MTLRTLNYGNYGIFLIMGSAGFCPSAVEQTIPKFQKANVQRQLPMQTRGRLVFDAVPFLDESVGQDDVGLFLRELYCNS